MKREPLSGALVRGTWVALRGPEIAWGRAEVANLVREFVTVIRGYRVGGELKYLVRRSDGSESTVYESDLACPPAS